MPRRQLGLLCLLLVVATAAAQTFQYTKGWNTNSGGKRFQPHHRVETRRWIQANDFEAWSPLATNDVNSEKEWEVGKEGEVETRYRQPKPQKQSQQRTGDDALCLQMARAFILNPIAYAQSYGSSSTGLSKTKCAWQKAIESTRPITVGDSEEGQSP